MNTAAQSIGATRPQAGELSERFLTFQLAGEEYGIAIMKVQEIIGTRTDHSYSGAAGVLPGCYQPQGQGDPND